MEEEKQEVIEQTDQEQQHQDEENNLEEIEEQDAQEDEEKTETETEQLENEDQEKEEAEQTDETGSEETEDKEESSSGEQEEVELPSFADWSKEKFGKEVKPEEAQQKVIELTEQLEDYKKKNEEANKKLLDVFKAESDLLNIVRDVSDGYTVKAAIAKNMDVDELKDFENIENEDLEKARKERKERLKKQKQQAQTVQANIQQAGKNVQEFMDEKKIDKKRMGKFLDTIDQVVSNIYNGNLTKDILDMMYTALTHEGELRAVAEKAEIEGRNKGIKEGVKGEKPKGDGLPTVSGGGELPEKKTKKTVDDVADVFIQSIDRANRKPY